MARKVRYKKGRTSSKFYKKILFLLIPFLAIIGFKPAESRYFLTLIYDKYIDIIIDPPVSGKVIKVIDGDTVIVINEEKKHIKVRLYGIDAPEINQPYGTQSKKNLSNYLSKGPVELKVINKDQYERSVALLMVNSENINKKMVESGSAWVYTSYCKKSFCNEWNSLQKTAKLKKIGLWHASKPKPPWEFRKQRG